MDRMRQIATHFLSKASHIVHLRRPGEDVHGRLAGMPHMRGTRCDAETSRCDTTKQVTRTSRSISLPQPDGEVCCRLGTRWSIGRRDTPCVRSKQTTTRAWAWRARRRRPAGAVSRAGAHIPRPPMHPPHLICFPGEPPTVDRASRPN
jgi:hypothetical protein